MLPNGMQVLVECVPYVRSVSAGLWIRTGSASEHPAQAGISHFLEHLFFKGTTTRPARQLMEEIEGRGGQLNSYTSRDYICLYAHALDVHTGSAIEILADILNNSQFFDFEKERNVVLEEIASAEDIPEDYAHDLLLHHLWPDHPLGNPVSGFRETVERITMEGVQDHYHQWCRPANILLSIAGNVSEETILEHVREKFDDVSLGTVPEPYTMPKPRFGVRAAERDIAQVHFCAGFPGPAMTDNERYACELLTSALGGGAMSRLFDRIREQEGLVYAIYSFRAAYHRAGVVGIYGAMAPENLSRTFQLTREEIQKLCESLMPEAELASNAEQIKGNLLMGLESTYNRMARNAKSMIYFGRIIPIEEIVAGIDSVTPGDILRSAQTVFQPGRYAMAILGPQGAPDIEVMPL